MVNYDKESRYQFNDQDYCILSDCLRQIQTVLGRAKVIEKRTRHSANMLPAVAPIVREVITPENEEKVFGAKSPHLIYYNYDLAQWSSERLSGLTQKYQNRTAALAWEFKNLLESYDDYSASHELVAFVTRTALTSDFHGFSEIVTSPQDKSGGTFLVNFISRDKQSGKIIPMSNKFLGVSNYPTVNNAVQIGGSWFFNRAMVDPRVVAKILDTYVHIC